jgi:hypothetical protein
MAQVLPAIFFGTWQSSKRRVGEPLRRCMAADRDGSLKVKGPSVYFRPLVCAWMVRFIDAGLPKLSS